jgi:hypothetical protein
MPFPDLQLVSDILKAPGETLPNVAEATGTPDAGNNTFLLPFVDAGVDPGLIDPSRLKIMFDPDPGRAAGGTLNPGVTDMRFVSLSADKRMITLDFAQSGGGDCRISVEVMHTIPGVGSSSSPLVIGSGSGTGGGGGGPPSPFTATLSPLFTTTLEIGAILNNPQFNATYSPAATETSASLQDDQGNGPVSVLGLLNPLTFAFANQKSANGDTVLFTLQAGDGVNFDNDVVTATWYPRIYWGVDANPALGSEADIEGLANSSLQGSRALSTTLAPVNQFIYFAMPTAYGPTSGLNFQFGTFGPGGFVQQVASVAVTANTAGAPVQTYELWRSSFLQDTTISGPQPFIVT